MNTKKLNKINIKDSDYYLGYWLRFVSNKVTDTFKKKLSKKNVTVAEWLALRYLLSCQSCSLTELAENLGMTKGALSRMTDSMEKRGLIHRHVNSKDRRLFSIELSGYGSKLLPELAKIADENDKYFFGHLSKKENSAIKKLLQDIVLSHKMTGQPLD